MVRDAPRAGIPLPEYADGVGIAWQPKPYVLTNAAFFCTMADLLVVVLTTVADFALCITFLLSPCPQGFIISHHHVSIFNSSSFILSGMLSVEVHEDMREAANNLVKHFHKPEQEVCGCDSECIPQRQLLHCTK